MARAGFGFKEEWKDRRLGVVMFLDMVGYSTHMSKDETHAMARVEHLSKMLHRIVPHYAGRLVKFLGDGTMAEFHTAVTAVACSMAILEAIRVHNAEVKPSERFEVRIGLHLGDLVEKDNDLFGDTVNVAARIQPQADPGGLAMSSNVYFSVRTQLHLRGGAIGSMKLKGISERIRVYAVPPPHVSFWPWLVQRRNPVKTRLQAAVVGLTAVVVIGMFGFLRHGLGAPTAAMISVRLPVVPDKQMTEVNAYADALTEELNNRGGAIPEWQWKDRSWVLSHLATEGVTDPRNGDQTEMASMAIARHTGLAWIVSVRVEDGGMGNYRATLKVTNASTMAVAANFTASDRSAARTAETLATELRAWADRALKPEADADRPKAKEKKAKHRR